MNKDELQEILRKHKMWLEGKEGGEKANLCQTDLRGTDFSGMNLSHADLSGADLSDVDFNNAVLRKTNFYGADLCEANFRRAELSDADLSYAVFYKTDFRGANLYDANLRNADFYGSKFNNTDLTKLIAQTQVCPETGAFDAYKAGNHGHIIKLRIPAGAKRLTAFSSRKCRTERAIVKAIWDADGNRISKTVGLYKPDFIYEVGKVVSPNKFDDDPRVECGHGVHFFVTKEEAESEPNKF